MVGYLLDRRRIRPFHLELALMIWPWSLQASIAVTTGTVVLLEEVEILLLPNLKTATALLSPHRCFEVGREGPAIYPFLRRSLRIAQTVFESSFVGQEAQFIQPAARVFSRLISLRVGAP
jgi:hypothetical protein